MELNKIYPKDARHMDEVKSGSVQLIVTSPPYNVGKPYDAKLADEEQTRKIAISWVRPRQPFEPCRCRLDCWER